MLRFYKRHLEILFTSIRGLSRFTETFKNPVLHGTLKLAMLIPAIVDHESDLLAF